MRRGGGAGAGGTHWVLSGAAGAAQRDPSPSSAGSSAVGEPPRGRGIRDEFPLESSAKGACSHTVGQEAAPSGPNPQSHEFRRLLTAAPHLSPNSIAVLRNLSSPPHPLTPTSSTPDTSAPAAALPVPRSYSAFPPSPAYKLPHSCSHPKHHAAPWPEGMPAAEGRSESLLACHTFPKAC